MSNNDIEMISEKPIAQMTYREVLGILLKRLLALPSKLVGFKPACLYLATYLYLKGDFPAWAWLSVLVVVLFGREGLKIITGLKK